MIKNLKLLVSIYLFLILTVVFLCPISAKVKAMDNTPTPAKVPVILLHGRDDNSEACFGALNKITSDINSKYIIDNDFDARDTFSDLEMQKIQRINGYKDDEDKDDSYKLDYNLAYELSNQGYEMNKTLFVFNYPNVDFVKKNAEILSKYIDKLKKIYGYTKFDLVGHSKGGLVSRYYIENLEGNKNIRKLITIDTPHWGSFWSYSSFLKPVDFALKKLPCDVDLEPSSRLYGGSMNYIIPRDLQIHANPLHYIDEVKKWTYMINKENQSDALDYTKKGNTEYYAIAGINYWRNEIELKDNAETIIDIPSDKIDAKDIAKILNDWDCVSNSKFENKNNALKPKFTDFIRGVINPTDTFLTNLQTLLELANDPLTESLGDDIVNLKSQIGWRNKEKIVPMKKISININPIPDNIANHAVWKYFHSVNQHTKPVIDKVIEYLNDGENIQVNSDNSLLVAVDADTDKEKVSYINLKGEVILTGIYDNGKYGLMNNKGEVIVKPVYDKIEDSFLGGLTLVELNNKYGLINTKGEVILNPIYDHIDICEKEYLNYGEVIFEIKLNDKCGFVNSKGIIIVEPIYEDVDEFHKGLSRVQAKNGKYGVINSKGVVIIPPIYDKVKTIDQLFYISNTNDLEAIDGLIAVQLNNKWGCIDLNGNVVLKPIYDSLWLAGDEMIHVFLNNKRGFSNLKGELIIPTIYEEAYSFSEGIAGVKSNNKWIFINLKGDVITDVIYDAIGSFSEGLAAVNLNGKWGVINNTGRLVIPHKYDGLGGFSEGHAVVKIGKKYGFIDTDGQVVIQPKYDKVWYQNDFLYVGLNEKKGFINFKENIIVEPMYDYISDFGEGIFEVRVNKKSGLINSKGEILLKPIYDEINQRYDKKGLTKIRLNGKCGLINSKGSMIAEPIYEAAIPNPRIDNVWVIELNGKEGVIGSNGILVPPIYDDVRIITSDIFIVELNNKYIFINLKEGITKEIK